MQAISERDFKRFLLHVDFALPCYDYSKRCAGKAGIYVNRFGVDVDSRTINFSSNFRKRGPT